jgi:hypothetical protein
MPPATCQSSSSGSDILCAAHAELSHMFLLLLPLAVGNKVVLQMLSCALAIPAAAAVVFFIAVCCRCWRLVLT